jgi:hypothetical protein
MNYLVLDLGFLGSICFIIIQRETVVLVVVVLVVVVLVALVVVALVVVVVDVRIYQQKMVVIGLTMMTTGVPRTRKAKRLVVIGVHVTVEVPSVIGETQIRIVAFVVVVWVVLVVLVVLVVVLVVPAMVVLLVLLVLLVAVRYKIYIIYLYQVIV